VARVVVSRLDLERAYPGAVLEGFEPNYRVEVLDARTRKVIREDYVDLRGPEDRGIRFAFGPVDPEPLYAVVPPSRWQALEVHGRVRARPVRYVPDYRRPSDRLGYVYFIQRGPDGPIKIGWSEDVERRLSELQTANAEPLHVLGKIEGTMADEAATHAKFASFRMEAEWFRSCPEILDYVRHALGGL
jgi:hypothetical protein